MIARIPEHVFVSYSRADAVFVANLRQELEANGIPVWIDTNDLVPGTPDWEIAIRQAIEASYAVIMVGSPEAAISSYVRAEFAVAQGKGIPVIPLWLRGITWVDAAPLEAAPMQYVDLRDTRYQAGLSATLSRLRDVIAERKPKHFLIEDPFGGWYDRGSRSPGFDGVPTYISILLDRPPSERPRDDRTREEKMVVFNADRYSSLQQLLDDLYSYYLKKDYSPLSYGLEWVLLEVGEFQFEGINPHKLVLPWEWLTHAPAKAVASFAPYWARSPLETFGLAPHSIFSVRRPLEDDTPTLKDWPIFGERVYGLAVNSATLLDEVLRGPGKQPFPPYNAGFLELAQNNDVEKSRYRYRTLLLDQWSGQPFAGRVLRQTDKTFSEEYDREWL